MNISLGSHYSIHYTNIRLCWSEPHKLGNFFNLSCYLFTKSSGPHCFQWLSRTPPVIPSNQATPTSHGRWANVLHLENWRNQVASLPASSKHVRSLSFWSQEWFFLPCVQSQHLVELWVYPSHLFEVLIPLGAPTFLLSFFKPFLLNDLLLLRL